MAAAPFSWIKPEPHGIHVVPADCWIDPSRAVDRALVTHGHADHARGGHGQTVATPTTLAIMELRYATREGATPVEYGETISLPGGVDATYIPAGHVLGSAQILLEHAGERVVVTGDYKRRADPTCPPFQSPRAISSSPRRPSGCRCFATRRSRRKWPSCSNGSPRIPIAACWSAPMRWARRSG
jgi:putative mRNA 3-end processing factor